MRQHLGSLAWLCAAAALCAVAMCGPIDRMADASFAWHMAQHVVLLYAVPACLLLANPFALAAAAFGNRYARPAVRAARAVGALAHPGIALSVFVGTLWVTHFTGLYELALEHPFVHVAEHGLYLFAGIVLWLPVIAPAPLRQPSYPARLFYLFVALPQGALVAFAIDGARWPLYAHYARDGVAQALTDQRAAAAVMWIAGGLMLFSAFLIALGAWARRETRAMLTAAALAVSLGWLVAHAAAAAAQTPPPAPQYLDAQARLGQTLFYENCAECHGGDLHGNIGPALAGGDGNVQWDTVTYVWNYMTAHMPAGNAGALPERDYVEIMAFLLKEHGHPPGKAPLTAQTANASKAPMGPP